MERKVIRQESRTVLRVLDEDESRAIKATSTADEMNGCFLISSIGSNQRVGRGGNDYMAGKPKRKTGMNASDIC